MDSHHLKEFICGTEHHQEPGHPFCRTKDRAPNSASELPGDSAGTRATAPHPVPAPLEGTGVNAQLHFSTK